MQNNPDSNTTAEKKKLPFSFKFALLLFFISLQCFLGALYLKERENISIYKVDIADPKCIRRSIYERYISLKYIGV